LARTSINSLCSLASPSGLRGTQTYYSLVPRPRVQTPTVGALGRYLLHVTPFPSGKAWMADGFRPLHLGTIMRFGSLEFMSLGSGYDMVLLPPRDDTEPRPKPLPPQPVNGRRLGHHAGEPGVGDRGLGSLTPFLGPRHPGPPPACLSSNCPCFWPTMSQGKASQSCKLCPLA
jgi:hypothetical protein